MRRDTVLVVDDTPETLGFLTDTLDHAGFTVLIATDGESALALVEQVTPDLVLMDAVMPGMDGFETCRRLKGEKLLAYLPIIFMTGLSETEHVVRGLAAGGVDYVTKPIVIDELLARIRVHLANARRRPRKSGCTGRLRSLPGGDRQQWATVVVYPQGQTIAGGAVPSNRGCGTESAAKRGPPTHRDAAGNGLTGSRTMIETAGRKLELTFLSSTGPDELLFRLTEQYAPDELAAAYWR